MVIICNNGNSNVKGEDFIYFDFPKHDMDMAKLAEDLGYTALNPTVNEIRCVVPHQPILPIEKYEQKASGI